jgi:hypothetical protein
VRRGLPGRLPGLRLPTIADARAQMLADARIARFLCLLASLAEARFFMGRGVLRCVRLFCASWGAALAEPRAECHPVCVVCVVCVWCVRVAGRDA